MPEVKDISKVYLAAINSKGVKSGGYKVTPYRATVVAAVNTFGRFALTQDNTAPSLQPINGRHITSRSVSDMAVIELCIDKGAEHLRRLVAINHYPIIQSYNFV